MNRSALLVSRNPTFRNFLAATTVSLFGGSVFDIAMPLYVWELTRSPIDLALVNFGIHLPYFLMAPLTGYTVDTFDKRRVMLAADIGQIACLLFLIVNDLAGSPSVWSIVAAVFLIKTLMIMFETVTTFQLIPALVSPQDLSSANTWFLSSLRLIQVFGPVSGGLLMSAFGVRSCIVLNMLTFAATLTFVYRMKNLTALIEGQDRHIPASPSATKLIENFVDSLRYVMSSKLFRPFIPLMFLWNLSPLIPSTPSITYYFTAVKGFSAAEYGAIISLIGVFGIIGYLIASFTYDRADFGHAFVGSALWQAAFGTLAVLFMPFPLVMAVLFSISRAGSSVLNMGTFLIRQTRVPKAKMGGINACVRMFFMSAAPLSALLQGYLIEHLGVGISFIFGAACLWGVTHYSKKMAAIYATHDNKPEAWKGPQAA